MLTVAACDLVASTGPRSEERGVEARIYGYILDVIASTGPRSEERGVGHRSIYLASLDIGLQRGRAPKSAECGDQCNLWRHGGGFNGAALRRARSDPEWQA